MLRHPVAVLAVILLLVNDHVLKAAFPGTITGKLSDIAGLVVFPLLLAEGWLAVRRLARHPVVDPKRVVGAAALTTGVAFALVKTVPVVSAAWAWAWGFAQWMAASGLFPGRHLLAVAVVRDPTDLLALPAVLVAVWVARRTPRPDADSGVASAGASDAHDRRRWAGPVMGVVTAIASMATSQSAPGVSTDTTATVTLTADAPVAVRHITWSADLGASTTSDIRMTAHVSLPAAGDDAFAVPAEGVLLTLIPDDDSSGAPDDWEGSGQAYRSLVRTTPCGHWCSGGARLIVRAIDHFAAGAPPLALVVTAAIRAVTVSDETAAAASAAIAIDPDASFDGSPSTAKASMTTVVRVGKADEKTIRLMAVIKAAALDDPVAWPLVARLLVSEEQLEPDSNPEDWGGLVQVGGGEGTYIAADAVFDRDLLGECRAHHRCELPLRLTTEYDVRWTVEVRLEAFDGRMLPADAVSVTAP